MWTKEMLLERTLADDLYGRDGHQKGEDNLYGVEVELEGKNICNPPRDLARLWSAHDDGSLRARNPGDEKIEYVLAKPLGLEDTKAACRALMGYLTTAPAQVYESYRTSIHVHVNCLNEKQVHIANYLTMAIITDELFVSLNGEHRKGNNFCLRAGDAEGMVEMLIKSIEQHGQLYQLNRDHRYSSVNVASLLKFGTVEFRSLECTTDYDRLVDWITTLHNMKEASRGFKDPREVVEAFSRLGPTEFLWRVLGRQALKYVAVAGADRMLFRGMRLAQDFAFCSTWLNKADHAEAKPQVKKKAPPYAYGGFAAEIARAEAPGRAGVARNDWVMPPPVPAAPPPRGNPGALVREAAAQALAQFANVPLAAARDHLRGNNELVWHYYDRGMAQQGRPVAQ